MDGITRTGPTVIAHAPEVSKGLHLPHLDSLRGIAALLVVVHHAYLECPPSPGLAWWTAWMAHGHFLVTFFIILSGYCLTLPTLADGRIRGGLVGFVRRRTLRLLPAYYAAMALSIALIATLIGNATGRHWDFAVPVDARSVVMHALLIHNYDLSTLLKINHVFWSIAVEWQIYFAFPVLLWLARRSGIWASASVALALGYLGYSQVGGTLHVGMTPHYYGMFALGMLAAHLGHAPAVRGATDRETWWTLGGLGLLSTMALGPSQTYEVMDLPFGVACVAGLVALTEPSRLRTWLSRRPLVGLGGFSYSLYLTHAPVQHLVVVHGFGPIGLDRGLELPVMLAVGTPLALVVSYGFYRLFERPFLPSRVGPARRAGRDGRISRPGPAGFPGGRRVHGTPAPALSHEGEREP